MVFRMGTIHFHVIDNIAIVNNQAVSTPNGVIIFGHDFGANECFFNDDGSGTYSSDLTHAMFDNKGRLKISDL